MIVDKEDYLANQDAYLKLEAEIFPADWKLVISQARGMGDKVREQWGLVKDRAWCSLLNDDHLAVTPEWDIKLIKQLNGKNFVSCNDRWNAPARAAGCTMWSMALLECVGWPIFPRQINHLGIDDVWEQLGRTTGVWRVCMNTVVTHQHVFKGAELDETHKLTYGTGSWQGSPAQQDVQARMQTFMRDEFPGAVEKIKAFAGTYNYFVKPGANTGAQMHGGQK